MLQLRNEEKKNKEGEDGRGWGRMGVKGDKFLACALAVAGGGGGGGV